MRGDVFRRVEIFGHQAGRDGQRVGCIEEALAGSAVRGELARWLQVHPGQIPYGVAILRVVQATYQHGTGVTGAAIRFMFEETLNPGDQLLSLLWFWLRFSLGRHFLTLEHVKHFLPGFKVRTDFTECGEPLDIESGLLDFRRMALQAIRCQERADPIGILLCRNGGHEKLHKTKQGDRTRISGNVSSPAAGSLQVG